LRSRCGSYSWKTFAGRRGTHRVSSRAARQEAYGLPYRLLGVNGYARRAERLSPAPQSASSFHPQSQSSSSGPAGSRSESNAGTALAGERLAGREPPRTRPCAMSVQRRRVETDCAQPHHEQRAAPDVDWPESSKCQLGCRTCCAPAVTSPQWIVPSAPSHRRAIERFARGSNCRNCASRGCLSAAHESVVPDKMFSDGRRPCPVYYLNRKRPARARNGHRLSTPALDLAPPLRTGDRSRQTTWPAISLIAGVALSLCH